MATQLVQYMDLRLTIDNNPPPYGQQVPYQVRKKKEREKKREGLEGVGGGIELRKTYTSISLPLPPPPVLSTPPRSVCVSC